ncbi:L-glyceraldehyde 3-phosphate reductase [Prolixibacteraceae bacterium JC049]|nr:L-glyceraldehyde 3-phosphate reductase [Prolixibacteraceae bacterium JC049]
MNHNFVSKRYSNMQFRRSGNSGLLLPAISLGLWHNFGGVDVFENGRQMVLEAFDNGITYLDLANNYGPPPGSAEETFGKIMAKDLHTHRDELVIATKAGYLMWDGPYGDWGSRKYLISSLNQSLKRMGLEYVDVFYSHRYDPNTPLEETMGTLDHIVRSGKALYAGISNYPADVARKAFAILKELGTPCVMHQIKYSMFVRDPEEELFGLHKEMGVGCVAFSPLAQGLLTDKYLKGIPEDSRAAKSHGFLKEEAVDPVMDKVRRLNEMAQNRGQSLAQMAIAWQLTDERVTSVLVGASSVNQLHNNLKALDNTSFSSDELEQINSILNG